MDVQDIIDAACFWRRKGVEQPMKKENQGFLLA